MALLLTAAAAARVEASGSSLADVCALLSSDRRARGVGLVGVDVLPGVALPFFGVSLIAARRTIAGNKAISAVDILVRRSDDDSVELIRVGKRGGWKRITRIWNKHGEAC